MNYIYDLQVLGHKSNTLTWIEYDNPYRLEVAGV